MSWDIVKGAERNQTQVKAVSTKHMTIHIHTGFHLHMVQTGFHFTVSCVNIRLKIVSNKITTDKLIKSLHSVLILEKGLSYTELIIGTELSNKILTQHNKAAVSCPDQTSSVLFGSVSSVKNSEPRFLLYVTSFRLARGVCCFSRTDKHPSRYGSFYKNS